MGRLFFGFELLLNLLEDFALARGLIKLLELELALYLLLVLAGKKDVARRAFYFYEVYL